MHQVEGTIVNDQRLLGAHHRIIHLIEEAEIENVLIVFQALCSRWLLLAFSKSHLGPLHDLLVVKGGFNTGIRVIRE